MRNVKPQSINFRKCCHTSTYHRLSFTQFLSFSSVQRPSLGRSTCKITNESIHQRHRDATSATSHSPERSILSTTRYGITEQHRINVPYAIRNTLGKSIWLITCVLILWFVILFFLCRKDNADNSLFHRIGNSFSLSNLWKIVYA